MGSSLPSFQDQLLDELKDRGLVPMTSGITKALPLADSYDAVFALAQGEVDRAVTQFGPRTFDRYSTTVGNSYRDQRFQTLAGFEGIRTKVYDDKGVPAIGLGFRMTDASKPIWKAAFGNTVSFEDAKSGKVQITSAQAKTLFDHSALYYEKLVDKATEGRTVTQNQRVALFSLAYNAPKRFAEMTPLVKSGDDAAVTDFMLTKSFAPGNAALLKSRRYAEATLYTSTLSAKDVMPTFQSYDAAVHVDEKTGTASIRAVGSGNIHDLDPEFQRRLAAMIDSAPDDIKKGLAVYSGYRDVAKQTKLFNEAVKKYGSVAAARIHVAPPGGSQHNAGRAVDMSFNGLRLDDKKVVKAKDWVAANAPKFGLALPMDYEPWHVEPAEARKVGMKGTLLTLGNLAPIGPNAPKPMPGRPAALSKAPVKDNPAANDPHVDTMAKHLLAQYTDNTPAWIHLGNGVFTTSGAAKASTKVSGSASVGGPLKSGTLKSATVIKHLDGTTSVPEQISTVHEENLPNVVYDPKTGKLVRVSAVPQSAPPAQPNWITYKRAQQDGTLQKVTAFSGVKGQVAGIIRNSNPISAPVPYSRPVVSVRAPTPMPGRPAALTKSEVAAQQPGYGERGYSNTNTYKGDNPAATTWNPNSGGWDNN